MCKQAAIQVKEAVAAVVVRCVEVPLMYMAPSISALQSPLPPSPRTARIIFVHPLNKTLSILKSLLFCPAAPPPAEADLEAEDGEDAAAAAAVGLPPVRVVLPPDFALPESCVTLLDELARLVYTHGNDNQKGQAMLCGVYFRCVLQVVSRCSGAGCCSLLCC